MANLDGDQTKALSMIQQSFEPGNPPKTLVFGPPGSGKSYVLTAAIRWAGANKFGVVVCAPTARAVTSIQENLPPALSNTPCFTIHRILQKFKGSQHDHLPPFMSEPAIGGLLIIDEVGMMSSALLASLVYFRLGNRANVKVVFSGDCDQLPPVSGKPFYVLDDFAKDLGRGAVQYAPLRGNHRNGECKKLQAILEPFKTGVLTQRARDLLDEIARKKIPAFVWLYIAHRHDNLHRFNDRKAKEAAARNPSPTKVLLRPADYPTRLCLFSPSWFDTAAGTMVEGTRIVVKRNINDGDTCVAANGDYGNVLSVLCTLDKRGQGNFSRKAPEALLVRLDRSPDAEVTVNARAIKCDESKKLTWVVDVALGYAGTIHTQQGRTIPKPDIVTVNLEAISPASAHVALSRVQDVNQLRFDCYDPERLDEIFKRPEETEEKTAFYTQLPLLGKRVEQYKAANQSKALKREVSLKRKRKCFGL